MWAVTTEKKIERNLFLSLVIYKLQSPQNLQDNTSGGMERDFYQNAPHFGTVFELSFIFLRSSVSFS